MTISEAGWAYITVSVVGILLLWVAWKLYFTWWVRQRRDDEAWAIVYGENERK